MRRTGRHPWIGRDVGEAMGGAPMGVIATDDALEAFSKAQAVVDFTAPPRRWNSPPSPRRPARSM
jgi:dihydrodipicolinate reductase